MNFPIDARLPIVLLQKLSAYREGKGSYNFSRLSRYDRENAAFDAWQALYAEIKSFLTDESRGFGKCKTCRFWGENCRSSDGFKNCESNFFLQEGQVDRSPASCDFEPCEGGRFFTGPEFGCIHWQQKTEES